MSGSTLCTTSGNPPAGAVRHQHPRRRPHRFQRGRRAACFRSDLALDLRPWQTHAIKHLMHADDAQFVIAGVLPVVTGRQHARHTGGDLRLGSFVAHEADRILAQRAQPHQPVQLLPVPLGSAGVLILQSRRRSAWFPRMAPPPRAARARSGAERTAFPQAISPRALHAHPRPTRPAIPFLLYNSFTRNESQRTAPP